MSTFQRAKTAQITAATEIDWSSVYEELLPKVYHYFCLRTGDRLEAEDLTAVTFERAWRDRERYQKNLGTFTSWLFGIAHHVAITHFRENKQGQATADSDTFEVSRPTEEAANRQEEFE